MAAKKKPTKKKVTSESPKKGDSTPAPKTKRKYKISKSLKLYNRLQKEFKKQNDKLPDEQKIPFQLRRKIISQQLFPNLKKLHPSFLTAKSIRANIADIIENSKPAQYDIRLLEESDFALVPYFQLDEFIGDKLPKGLYVRVNSGTYAPSTGIFNTADYDYHKSGVYDIVEEIRKLEGTELEPNYPTYGGVVLVKPHRMDDGNPANYYLELQLSLNGVPVDLSDEEEAREEVHFVPVNKKDKERKREMKKLMAEKIKNLTKVTRFGKKKPPVVTKPTPPAKKETKPSEEQTKSQLELVKETNKLITKLEGLYKRGLMSKKDMMAAVKQAVNLQVPQAVHAPQKAAKQIPIGKKATAKKKTVPKKKK